MFTEPRTGGDCETADEECRRLSLLCRELRKEKDALKVSLSREQSVNAELIRRFELEAQASSQARLKDKKQIKDLQRELRNCSQEIAFLQDQLCRKNEENQPLDEHVHAFGKGHVEIEKLYGKLKLLENELVHSESMRMFSMHKAEENSAELQNLSAQVEKLEAAVSSIQLESQCEVESMKLEMMTMEQRCFEAERSFEQAAKEKTHIESMFKECILQLKETQKRMGCLETENKKLLENIISSERCIKMLFCELDGHLKIWLKRNPTLVCQQEENSILPANVESELALYMGHSYKDVLHPFLVKFFLLTSCNECGKLDMQKMPTQISESERLIAQLKEELQNEKKRSKEEAEDLIQAMAELRYQITDMLEEETRRRAIVEHASLKRIQELEAEVEKEKLKSSKAIRHLNKTRQLVKHKKMEIRHLKHSAEGSSEISTIHGENHLDDTFYEDLSDDEVPSITDQACIEWYRDETKE